ncbi:UNVERIFIED_CONTAM: RNA recognition motif-containing protein [Siphonaria sp. JEL0065]|nr:RNA recognition motif-containing protein [Siphonaria sp. JEL0065]
MATLSPSTTPTPASVKDSKYNAACVFVRQLPFEATSAQLEEFFGSVGPIKSAFVVADKDTPGKNKGFGFVTFAVKADAAKALLDLADKKFLDQRKLRLELAVKKNLDPSERPPKPEKKAPVTKKNPHPSFIKKPPPKEFKKRESRLVEISKLPDGIEKSHVKHKAKKMGNVIEVFYPILDADGNEVKGVAHIKYRQATDAAFAAERLNNHVFKGVTIFAKLLEVDAQFKDQDPEAIAARESKKSRLIIRNLNFSTTEKQLQKAFTPFGNISRIDLPQQTSAKGTLTGKGFAFVQFEHLEDAESALEKVNGSKIAGRVVAVDWALSKADFARLAAEEEEEKEKAASADVADDGDAEGDNDEEADEVAVDISPEEMDVDAGDEEVDPEQEGEDDEEEEGDSDQDEEHDHVYPAEADEDDDVEITLDNQVIQEGKGASSNDGEDDEDAEDEEVEEVIVKKNKLEANVDEGCTLFVRNLLFESTEEELFARFVTFGKLRYARITKDPQSGKSRGTGFICFYQKSDADACMIAYEAAAKSHALFENALEKVPTAEETNSKNKRDAKNKNLKSDKKFGKPEANKSMLVPEPSTTSAVTAPFILGGRFLNLSVAVTKQESEKLTSKGVKDRRANDRRHMYLIKEGVIFPNSKEADGILPTELSRRQKSYTERKRLLATNPNLYLSRTRLSIRNLGLKVTEDSLKRAGILCVKRFWEEVKGRKRKGLEEEVLEEEKAEGHKPPGLDRSVKVAKVKIMLDNYKIDPVTKKGRSKGFGFLEFYTHADALACLRYLNANPRVFKNDGLVYNREELEAIESGEAPAIDISKARRPIVEFTVENRLIASKKAELVEKQRAAAKEAKANGVPLSKKVKGADKKKAEGKDGKKGAVDGKKDKKGDKKKRQRDDDEGGEEVSPNKKAKKEKKSAVASASDKANSNANDNKKPKSDDSTVHEAAGGNKKKDVKGREQKEESVGKKAKKVDHDAVDDQQFTQLLAKYGKGLFGPK